MPPLRLSIILAAINVYATLEGAHASTTSLGHGSSAHAAFVGTLAGQLSAGAALDELNKIDDHYASADGEHEVAGGFGDEHHAIEVGGEHESLGELGEHLSEHDFPHDFGGDAAAAQHGEGAEYAEEEEAADASEHLQHYAHDFDAHGGGGGGAEELAEKSDDHFGGAEFGDGHEISIGDDHGDDDDFHSKPVPGIDHGKGAFSYSTTYEFKDKPQDDEWKLR